MLSDDERREEAAQALRRAGAGLQRLTRAADKVTAGAELAIRQADTAGIARQEQLVMMHINSHDHRALRTARRLLRELPAQGTT